MLIMGVVLILTNGCKKTDENEENTNPTPTTVTDVDGNIYHFVTIGTQVWMVENLKVTHYRNGDAIPNITDNYDWGIQTSGTYANYNNNGNYVDTYGRLYNFYAACDYRKIAPVGWHVPTYDDWLILVNYLGDSVAGSKLKEAGLYHWLTPNNYATNESGFTALPGGFRGGDGNYYNLTTFGIWWSNTEHNSSYAWRFKLEYGSPTVSLGNVTKNNGYSIRCIKD